MAAAADKSLNTRPTFVGMIKLIKAWVALKFNVESRQKS